MQIIIYAILMFALIYFIYSIASKASDMFKFVGFGVIIFLIYVTPPSVKLIIVFGGLLYFLFGTALEKGEV